MSNLLTPSNLQRLASCLKLLRKKHRISLNALALLSGISRRTLARLESGYYQARRSGTKVPSLSPLATMRLLRLLLPPGQIDATLKDATKLSRAYASQLGGAPESYALIDLIPDFYPYFLFHPPQNPLDEFFSREFAPDYRDSLHRLVLRPPRNLGLRLRAFRLRHGLTLVQTADLLDISKSELHRIERGERSPSAQSAYRILRLLTSPSLAETAPQPGWVDPESRLAETKRPSCPFNPSPVTRYDSPVAPDSSSPLDSLRRLWLSGLYKTRELAAALRISQPHLIRLLRGERHPSPKLLDRICTLTRS